MSSLSSNRLLEELGVDLSCHAGADLVCRSPVDGAEIAVLRADRAADVQAKIGVAAEAWGRWRVVPAPRRGELIRLFGEELRAHKAALGRLVSIESGKILQEGYGEVQEMIDICDFAVGVSRQLYGLTIASERPGHRMMETWHPLGVVGVITAFNFPVAVWAWNASLALACGADGVHLGQEDLPLNAARKLIVGKIIGISTHNMEQARQAEHAGADYIGFGPVFETKTKDTGYRSRGLAVLREIRQNIRIPVVAIGGITEENAGEVWQAGAD